MKLAFLSPCWSGSHYGGVQLTARLALEALSRGGDSVRFLGYGPACQPGAHSDGSGHLRELCSRSKTGAAFAALRQRAWPDRLLFWHADLLKLLPFIGARGRRKLLFLHGIECWRRMDGALASGLDQIDLFLSNSDFTWQRFIAANPRWAGAKHRTVALGVGTPERNLEPPAKIPAAIMIGRMSSGEGYKGHEEVIGAWPHVLQAIPEAELWIVGGGDAAGDLRAQQLRKPESGFVSSASLPMLRKKRCCAIRAAFCCRAVARGSALSISKRCVWDAPVWQAFTTPAVKWWGRPKRVWP
jgi:phosphatidyl-myo-inositol dimannoside synthase